MDQGSILILTTALIVALALLVVAGLALSVRSYTLLLDFLRWLGSLVAPLMQAHLQALITSWTAMVQGTKSPRTDDTPTTQENQEPGSTG